jgi:hypothetical protein
MNKSSKPVVVSMQEILKTYVNSPSYEAHAFDGSIEEAEEYANKLSEKNNENYIVFGSSCAPNQLETDEGGCDKKCACCSDCDKD